MEQYVKAIKAKCGELNLNLGWRFLTCPANNLSRHTDIALITLNPGGSKKRDDHDSKSCEDGSAYIHESWGNHPVGESPLQTQIRSLFALIAEGSSNVKVSGDKLLEDSLTAQFIPFRSPTYAKLPRQKECSAFAKELWSQIFEEKLDPKLVINIDKRTFDALSKILSKQYGKPTVQKMPTGWGNISAQLATYKKPDGSMVKQVRFPHLSRFKIMGRTSSAKQVEAIITDICQVL